MAWSNKSTRTRLTVEKSHSLSLSVRVEDRLHNDIIQPGDKCWMTIRREPYSTTDATDTEATVKLDGVQVDTGQGKIFRLDIQASALNLDPEEEWFYDITYVTGGYSLSLISGDLVVSANPTNRGAGSTFTGGNGVYGMVATIKDRQLLNVTSSMPIPTKGDNGKGAFLTSNPLSEVVGTTVVVPAGTLDTYGRPAQVGDVLFSTTSKGVMAVISALNLTGGALVSVDAVVKQVYGLETLKAILDTVPRARTIATLGHTRTVPKADAPLPPSYQYRVGDLLFSEASEDAAIDTYLVISSVTGVGATDITAVTKIVFPMFTDDGALQGRFDAKVDKAQTINGVALTGTIVMDADKVPDGSSKVVMTTNERNKLAGVASGATANSTDAHLLNRAHHTGMQSMSSITNLIASLNDRPTSVNVGVIWKGTQAMYDQIVTKDPATLYFITS